MYQITTGRQPTGMVLQPACTTRGLTVLYHKRSTCHKTLHRTSNLKGFVETAEAIEIGHENWEIMSLFKRCSMKTFSKSSIFGDAIACSLVKVNWRFGGTCHLYLQSQWVSQVRNPHEPPDETELFTITDMRTSDPIQKSFKFGECVLLFSSEFFGFPIWHPKT
jgi:hypothetical protein